MNAEDTALCQQAIALANSGQKQRAYEQFCALHNHNNANDVTLLYWIAYTTPSMEVAQRAINTISRLEQYHAKLQELQSYVSGMQQRVVYAPHQYVSPLYRVSPVLQCPYCHHVGPVRIAQKISTGGWVCFWVLLFAFFPLCWIGLLIQQDYYACVSCGIMLGEAT